MKGLEFRKLADMPRDPNNARLHPPEQLEQIANSIRQFGFTIPGLFDTVVRVGDGRHGACELIYAAGETIYLAPGKDHGGEAIPVGTMPVFDCSAWSDDQKRAYALVDNQLALNSTWDEDRLRVELEALMAVGFDIPLIGFDEEELTRLFDASAPGRTNPDSVPDAPANPATKRDDVWIMDTHRLKCGDATEPRDVNSVLDQKAGLTLTDPPYGISYGYASHDDSDNAANAALVADAFALAPPAKVWTPGMMNLARDLLRFGQSRLAIWHKGFAQAGNGMGGASTIESVLIIDPPKKGLDNDYLHFGTDRIEVDGHNLRDLHPCPKPVELYAHLAEAFIKRGGVIYDPFCGSGTTLIACEGPQVPSDGD